MAHADSKNTVRGHALRLGPCALLLTAALSLPACEGGGHFSILGYTTQPNYDCNIHTVYVPIFENRTFRRGIEFSLTEAVVREIEAKTPFKVISDRSRADTELLGTIISEHKGILNRNQLNEVREAENVLTVDVVWKDLRTGEVISRPAQRAAESMLPPPSPLDVPGMSSVGAPLSPPTQPQPVAMAAADNPAPGGVPGPDGALVQPVPGKPAPPAATPVSSYATFIPELGGSVTSAEWTNVNRLAVQIVSMMEKAW